MDFNEEEIEKIRQKESDLFNDYLMQIKERVSNNYSPKNKEIDVGKLCEMQKSVNKVIGKSRTWLHPKYELSYMIARRNERREIESLLKKK